LQSTHDSDGILMAVDRPLVRFISRSLAYDLHFGTSCATYQVAVPSKLAKEHYYGFDKVAIS
jgi:hypothetical protein